MNMTINEESKTSKLKRFTDGVSKIIEDLKNITRSHDRRILKLEADNQDLNMRQAMIAKRFDDLAIHVVVLEASLKRTRERYRWALSLLFGIVLTQLFYPMIINGWDRLMDLLQ